MDRGWAGSFSGGGMLPPVPRATRWLLAAFVGFSLAEALGTRWLGLPDLATWAALVPGEVLHGQVWRLLTYPLLARDPLGLIFGALLLMMVGGTLESRWGTRRFIVRSLWLAGLPAALTTLLSLAYAPLQHHAYLGLGTLGLGYITAFASQMRGARVTLFPLPIVLSGDQLLWFEGGLLGLWMLFGGTTLPFVPELLAFLTALAWFRLGLLDRLRRRRSSRGGNESRLERLARQRRLHVVRNDEDDDTASRRRLH